MSDEDFVIKLDVNGQEVTLDVTEDCSITDIDTDMRELPGKLAWYGSLLSAARERADTLDAEYRRWRGVATVNVVESGKFPEHVVKAKVEGDGNFIKYKRAQAAADALVVKLEKAWASLATKGDMLRSLGARTRDEMRHTVVETRVTPQPARSVRHEENDEDEKERAAAKKIRESRNRKREEE